MNKKKIVGTLALFMFLLIGIQTVTAAPSAKDLLKEGDNYFKQGDYGKAIESYESILDLYPKAKEANDAKKKLADPKILAYQKAKQPQKITTPITEDDLEYKQNRTGGITITRYKDKVKNGVRDLVVPAQIQGINVTEIAEGAFAGGEYDIDIILKFNKWEDKEVFESVTIPSTVTSIGTEAFMARGIKILNLPEGVSISPGAFAENQLTSVTMPKNITKIPLLVFANNQLTSIDIPSSVTEIGSGAFCGNKLTELTIPENVTRINTCAFANNMISKINFSNSGKLAIIEAAAFSKNRLKSLVLPEGLTRIMALEGGYEIDRSNRGGYIYFTDFFKVEAAYGVFGHNPIGYIKIPSTLKGDANTGNGSYRPITTDVVPAIEWLQPIRGFMYLGNADALKIGDNISVGIDEGFNNFFVSQGKKAGIYMRRGQLWVTATQEEFDAFIAEKTK
ncbi:MAG: leucine-rich repeat protein [Bacteroidetes bacterium]|nr:leucine-rich repeat protein [Bacteroidota bacterium]